MVLLFRVKAPFKNSASYSGFEIVSNAQTNVSFWALSLLSIAQDKVREVGHYNMGGECTFQGMWLHALLPDAILLQFA